MLQLDARPAFRDRLNAAARDETEARSHSSALVFAPHPDDETLGCAGTVLLKRRAGTPVACAFMTDGSTSHRQFVTAGQLRLQRMQEAIEATGRLGIGREDVHFFEFADGRLASFQEQALQQVAALLSVYRPAEVYVPYRSDGVQDHEATYAIVVEACRRSGLALEVCEYPIWAWTVWPWVSIRLAPNRESIRALLRAARSGFGWQMQRTFQVGIRVKDLIASKREVLDCYQSQMAVPMGLDGWPTLREVSDGEFLACFFSDVELFRCTALLGSD
jgi:LmbE family N-acetylglucosaminyl deacetylase